MGAYEDEWYLLGKRQKKLTDRLKVVLYDEVFWQDGSLVLFRDEDDMEGWQMAIFSDYQKAKLKDRTLLSKSGGVGRC